MTYSEAVKKIDMQYEETLRRFSGNEKILSKFVRKFPADPTVSQLRAAVAEKDWANIETTAHTLKGVSGNLGFSTLFRLTSDLVAAVRSKNYDVAEKLAPEAISCADEICAVLNDISD